MGQTLARCWLTHDVFLRVQCKIALTTMPDEEGLKDSLYALNGGYVIQVNVMRVCITYVEEFRKAHGQ